MRRRIWISLRRHRKNIFISLFVIAILVLLWWLSQSTGKTLWEFVEILIIPVVLGIIAWLFNRAARKRDREIETDRQRHSVLTAYFDQMTDLILNHDLGNLKSKSRKPMKYGVLHVRKLYLYFVILTGGVKGRCYAFYMNPV